MCGAFQPRDQQHVSVNAESSWQRSVLIPDQVSGIAGCLRVQQVSPELGTAPILSI